MKRRIAGLALAVAAVGAFAAGGATAAHTDIYHDTGKTAIVAIYHDTKAPK